jgi:hypothetical protein
MSATFQQPERVIEGHLRVDAGAALGWLPRKAAGTSDSLWTPL